MPNAKKSSTYLEPFPRERFDKFCANLKILTKDFGIVPLKFLGSQAYIIEEICEGMSRGIANFIILKSRQIGSSTLFTALDLFWAFNYPGLSGAIITHDERLKNTFKNYLKIYRQNLPAGYKVRTSLDNRDMLSFENGSVLQLMTAGTKETSRGLLGTGVALNYLHKSEEAAYGNPEDLKNLQAALSQRYPHRLYINETTARGFNHFAETWKNSVNSALTKTIFVGWWRNELFRFEKDSAEYAAYWPDGEKPTALERKRVRDVKEQYDIDIEAEQLAWYRATLNEQPYNGDQSKMDEEFPWTAEHAFVATGSRFFTNDAITDQMRRARKNVPKFYKYQLGYDWRDTALIPSNDRRADLRIWEDPHPLGRYVVACDPAYGSSGDADRTAISIVRCFADRAVQVAEFASNSISTHQCAWVYAHLCGYYRNVRDVLEIQGPGQAVWGEVKKLKTEMASMFPGKDDGNIRNCLSGMQTFLYIRGDTYRGTAQPHFKTTGEIKWRGMSHLKDSVELDRLIVNSTAALEECNTIVIDEGSIEAESGEKDDRVIALMMANFAWLHWELPALRQQGMTMNRATQLQSEGKTVDTTNRMVLNYLQGSGMVDRPKDSKVLPLQRPYGR